MATGEGRRRIQITLSEKVLDEIDRLCEESGMARGTWIEYTLTMGIHSYGQLIDGLSHAMAKTGSED